MTLLTTAAPRAHDVLGTPLAPSLDDIARLAAQVCSARLALVCSGGEGRQHLEAAVGLDPHGTALDPSICLHALRGREPLVIPDTARDRRTAADPLVRGEHAVRFYAGAPLAVPGGPALGALCVLDKVPRALGADQLLALTTLARLAAAQVELGWTARDHGDARAKRRLLLDVFNGAGDPIAALAPDLRYIAFNRAYARGFRLFFGRRLAVGDGLAESIAQRLGDRDDLVPLWRRALAGEGFTVVRQFRTRDSRHRSLELTFTALRDGGGRVLGARQSVRDVTRRIRAVVARRDDDARKAFLLALSDRLRDLADPEAVTGAASELLGRHLRAAQVGYARADAAGFLQVASEWGDGRLPSNAGLRHRLDNFGRLGCDDRANCNIVVTDVEEDQRTSAAPVRAAYAAIGLRAFVGASLVKDGQLMAHLYVAEAEPRAWSGAEVALVREVAERTWAAVERTRAAAALRESEAFAQSMVESSADCIKVLDAQGCVVSINAPGLCLLEIDDFSRFKGAELATMWPEAARAGLRAALRQAEQGGTGRFYGECPTARGQSRWWDVVATPIADVTDPAHRLLVVSRDVTERRRVEQELERLNRTLELRVEQRTAERDRMWRLSADIMLVTRFDSTIVAVNPAWRTVLDWREHDLVGVLSNDFVHPDDVAATEMEAARLAAGQTTRRFENRYRHRDGSYRWLSWAAVANAQFIHAVGRDVTAERAAVAELAQAQETLRQSQKMEAVGQLTGGIAHDFNNMLAVVIGSLDLLGRRLGDADPRARRYVDSAGDAARRAATLTQRLLAFSRRQPLAPKPLDANKLIAGMSDLLRGSLGAGIKLETALADGLWRAFVDPNQLENALLNLAVNARDAMPGGGCLTIETSNARLDARHVAGHPGVTAGHYVLIGVSDTGCGMSPEVIARAFDPFFTTKDIGKGTGLGLSQVHGFVNQSGGHVKIHSKVDRGTTVRAYLPRHLGDDGPEPKMEAQLAMAAKADRREVVLVVEDDAAVRGFSAEALREFGYEVLEADGAAAALEALEAEPRIALMFTDVAMPDVDGRALAEQALKRWPGLKVLFTSGYTYHAIVRNGLLDPDAHLIGKPYKLSELAAKVRALMDEP